MIACKEEGQTSQKLPNDNNNGYFIISVSRIFRDKGEGDEDYCDIQNLHSSPLLYLISRLLTTLYNHPKALKYFSLFLHILLPFSWMMMKLTWNLHVMPSFICIPLVFLPKFEEENFVFTSNQHMREQAREWARDIKYYLTSSLVNDLTTFPIQWMLKISLMPSGGDCWLGIERENLNTLFLNKSNKANSVMIEAKLI